jgi:hypothetical protein
MYKSIGSKSTLMGRYLRSADQGGRRINPIIERAAVIVDLPDFD